MKLLDTLHRWTGGLVGLLLAIMGLTGAILVHRDAWVALPHAGDAQVQGTQVLAATAARLMADPARRPQSITFANADFGLDRLAYKGGAGAYVTQAGDPVIDWSSQWARPELWLSDFHQHLFAGEEGETVIGIAGLCGLFFVISGTILWWRTRRTFEFRLWPARMTRPSIVRQHRDLGIVIAPLLALSLVTGTVLVFRPLAAVILGPGAPGEIDRALKPPTAPAAALADDLDWAAMIRAARGRFPAAEVRSLALPRADGGLITLRMRGPGEWLPNGRTTVWFAADTGRIVAARDAADLSGRVTAYNALYPLHAGKVGGLPFRLVMTLSGLGLAMLGTFTLWSFWFRRPRRRASPKPLSSR
ncbi:putative iron-regulated membrane protein [Novosphingobium sp. PhB57]|uniref:PepSY-associated TM helix domain-containing protein n=1 Tax=Novosphingobium sp. PhB57 TaxID=2485107 RepID=UPI0010496252|nr:PepSY-associated TM helix domain-containing protein [Novosphingobium sp. PhB57]TCU58159.1 putative iron-regulated membrane protein [Novosphingobium sp. PhB57]